MNLQSRSDRRSLSIHRQVVKQLRDNPSLWGVPLRNLDRWEQNNGNLSVPQQIWKRILTTEPHEKIIGRLLSKSQESTHLRSSSPFVGIIDQKTREKIFRRYQVQ
jgi:hypothetical protein